MKVPPGRHLAVAGFVLTCSLLLSFVPLLRTLDYPLSLPFALLFSFVFGLMGWRRGRASRVLSDGARDCLTLAGLASAAVVVPISLMSLLEHVCEPAMGLLFFAIGPLASGLFCYALGWSAAPLIRRGWLAAACMGALLLLSAAVAVCEFLFSPGVRFYGTLYGLYHGAVYDESVFVELPYAWLRLWNLAGAAALLTLSQMAGKRGVTRTGMTVLVISGLAFLVLTLFSGRLGFFSTGGRLEAELSGRLETENFVVRFTPGGRGEEAASLIADELEFRASQLTETFALHGESSRITAYVYESPRQKRRLMGAGRTSIAKPWLRQLHVHTHTVGGSLLAHELAHVMVGALSGSWLRIPTSDFLFPRPGILEGAAVAAERGGALRTTHQWARAMREVGLQPDLESLLEGLSFWRQSSSLAYTACGSFVRYLLTTHGAEPFSSLYGGAEFEDAYGVSLARLLLDWNSFLDEIPLDSNDLALAEFVFSRRPVFDKVCPYAGGRCLERALDAVREGQSERVGPLAVRAFRLTKGELRLAQRFVRVLYAVDGIEQGSALVEILREQHDGSAGVVAEEGLALASADGLWLLGKDEEANRLYHDLANRPSARWLARGLSFRVVLSGLRVDDDVKRLVLGAFLRRDRAGLVQGLLGKMTQLPAEARLRLGMAMEALPALHDQAVAVLLSGLENLPSTDRQMSRIGTFALARINYLTDDFAASLGALATLADDDLTLVEREERDDWTARVKWKEDRPKNE